MARISPRRVDQAARADLACQVRSFHHAPRQCSDARPAAGNSRLALRRRAPDRRGDEPPGAPRGGTLRQGAAQSERRADSPGGALEIWIQGNQVDRPHSVRGEAAADHLEPRRAPRVRLLRERESGSGPSAMEPGDGAENRRVPQAQDAALQRIRRAGGEPLLRHGPEGELLSSTKSVWKGPLPWLKPAVFVGSLFPVFRLGAAAARGELGANPIATALNQLGLLTLTFLIAALACTPLKLVFGWTWPIRIRRMLGLFAFFYASLHFLTYAGLDQVLDL